MLTTKAPSLKRRWNMPFVGDKSLLVLFPLKKTPKPLSSWDLLSSLFSPFCLLFFWLRHQSQPQPCPPGFHPPSTPSPLRLLLKVTKTGKLEK
jgi:hypothetical protein